MPCPRLTVCVRRNPECGHAAIVTDWYENWIAWEVRREAENPGLYPPEVADWTVANPPPLFRDHLVHLSGERREWSAAA